jgi:hypothetical protein
VEKRLKNDLAEGSTERLEKDGERLSGDLNRPLTGGRIFREQAGPTIVSKNSPSRPRQLYRERSGPEFGMKEEQMRFKSHKTQDLIRSYWLLRLRDGLRFHDNEPCWRHRQQHRAIGCGD